MVADPEALGVVEALASGVVASLALLFGVALVLRAGVRR